VKPLKEHKKEKDTSSTLSKTPQSGKEVSAPERHTINPLLSPTKSTRLTMGSRVIILGTDNVEQRVPQYVGLEADIVLVPGKSKNIDFFFHFLFLCVIFLCILFCSAPVNLVQSQI
jgi:hypothetical protein